MDGQYGIRSCSSPSSQSEEELDLIRRGPWTVEEDLTLVNYIANHGEGRWNALARCAGLKRTGKSCRLRWLNYLRPDVRRGNITPEEQLLILELHSRWGNRWSKIAQHLPGRTDNEIKNYWRTRVQKQAKQLRCDVNSKQFKDTMRYLWMPRLAERIRAANGQTATFPAEAAQPLSPPAVQSNPVSAVGAAAASYTPDSSSLSHALSSDSLPDCYFQTQDSDFYSSSCGAGDGLFNTKPDVEPIACRDAPLISPHGCYYQYYEFQAEQGAGGGRLPETSSAGGADISGGSSWDVDDADDVMWYWRQQLCDDGLLL